MKFRIYELMAERGIKSVAALHRKLIEMRVPVSHSQLLRIVDNRADHWKVQYINAFVDIFECQVADLFKLEKPTED
ncbi:helix-turn-helix transcriptional regulator [Undibacterium cyanobacteriorum]|uniref:Helix-turn-helix transcriptional regulator n=1 Tax=Undibacterium cyanobacteriorum TaxID=3073561 RepID=A0ABY9RJD0_9BURK|nr:helix-turn-helix transcriptional regulator [Undibacterium sp. 20NA77.5]WMW81338.1 helix-turn-helix transcriptional regulator [Undibacterium sp. 20NA77.5]